MSEVSESSVESTGEVSEESGFSEEVSEESSEELELSEESGEEVEASAESEEEPESSEHVEKFLVNIDGQQVEVSKDELLNGYQRAQSANERFKEAARAKKEAEEIRKMVEEGGFEEALKLSKDPVAFRDKVESWLWAQLQRDQMDPKDREIEELRIKAKEADDIKARQKEAEEKQIFEQQREQAQEKYLKEFNSAFSAQGITPEPRDIQQVAAIMHEALLSNYEMPVADAIEVYMDRKNTEVESFLSKADIAKLEQLIGKDKMKQIRKNDLQKLKNPTGRKVVAKEEPKQNKEKIAASDFFNSLVR